MMMFSVVAVCCALEVWLAWYGQQSGELHRLQAEGCFYIMGGITFVYVGAATAQDVIALVKAFRGEKA